MNNSKVNAEVLGVLMALGNKYIDRLPEQVMKYLTQNADVNSIPAIDANLRIEEQNISKDARVFLTMLKLKYWCKSETEKDELINLLKENDDKNKNSFNCS